MKNLRNLSLLTAIVLSSATTRAADVTIPHIGRLLKSTAEGEVAVDGKVKLKFGIYKKNVDAAGETAANLIWEETYPGVDVHQGIYTVDLGDTTGSKAAIDSDDLAASPALWLEVTLYETDSATTGTALNPRMRIARVPLAHQADNANKLGGAPASDYLKAADFEAFKTELSGGSSGSGLTVPWAKLTNVPSGFSDGKDDGLTTVSVSGAIVGSGTSGEGEALKIKDKGIGTSLLDDNAVTTDKVVNQAITTEKLALGAVGTDQLAAQAVGSGQLKTDAVDSAQIKAGAVIAGKLGTGAVVAANLATGAVTSAAIQDGSIQAADLAAGSLSPTAFSTGSMTLDKLSLATAASGGTTCVLGQVPKVSSTGRWECGSDVGAGGTTNTTASGALLLTGLDFTVKPLGITVGYIGNDAVETAKIKDLNVTAAKLASDAAGLLKVTNGNAGVYGTNIGIGLASGITTVASTLAFGGDVNRSIGLERRTSSGAGGALSINAGAAFSGGADLGGGDLNLASGLATGAGNSRITFSTAGGGAAGTADHAVAERMRLDGDGDLALGMATPNSRLQVRGSAAVAMSVTTALSVTAVAPSTISSTAAWAAPLAVGDLITLAGGGTRVITSINAAKTIVTVETAFTGVPLALLAYSYQQPITRIEASNGAEALRVNADRTLVVPGVIDAPNTVESVGFNDPRVTSGASWAGCTSCVDKTTANAWVATTGNWGGNRLSDSDAYSTAESDVDRSSYIELALLANVYRSVSFSHLDWVTSRAVDVYVSFDNGGNWSFTKRYDTYRRDGIAPYVSTIRVVASNLPIGLGANIRIRLVAARGRMHFEGFGLSRINLPQTDSTADVGGYMGWTGLPFGSGWGNYGGGYTGCQYRRLGSVVYLRGLCNTGGNWGTSNVIGVLPAGFRPVGRSIFSVMANPDQSLRVDVATDGVINIQGGSGSRTGWVSLEGIQFAVD